MSSLKDLQDAAKAFDQNLPRGDAAWVAEADAALFDAVTRDLPPAPAHLLADTIAALDPARAADLLRRLLHDRMRALGTGAVPDDDLMDWPFDAETGAPMTEAPAIPPKLAEALVRAGRGERVHPRCGILPDGSRCDHPDHPPTCIGLRPRWADWRQQATTDPVALFAWWARWPEAPVGVAGGRPLGVVARDQRDAAIRFLMTSVDEHGVFSVRVWQAAQDCGISESTLRRAAKEMGIVKREEAAGGRQYWSWSWPVEAQQRFVERGQGNADLLARHMAEGKD